MTSEIPPPAPQYRLAFAMGGLVLGAVAGLLLLLPFFLSFSGGAGAVQWQLEHWLAGEHAYSLRQLCAGGMPYPLLVPAVLSPSLQLFREALVPQWALWRVVSSGLHGFLGFLSTMGFLLLAMAAGMVATSGVGQGMVFLWFLFGLVLSAALAVRGVVKWRALPRPD
jgi:hypothetical protein